MKGNELILEFIDYLVERKMPPTDFFKKYRALAVSAVGKQLSTTALLYVLENFIDEVFKGHGGLTGPYYLDVLEKINELITPTNSDFYFRYFMILKRIRDGKLTPVLALPFYNSLESDLDSLENPFYKEQVRREHLRTYIDTQDVERDRVSMLSEALKLAMAERNKFGDENVIEKIKFAQ